MLRSKIIVICFLFAGLVFCLCFSNIFAGDIDTDAIYADTCALCHGDDGKGSPTGIDFGVKDFTDAEWQGSRTNDDFVNSITNGNPENTNYLPFGDMLSEEEIKAMAGYVRKFAQ
jgi:mono/diheme cytochrome c family protein